MSLFPEFVLPTLLGFAIGSVPTTFLLLKWRTRVDIRNEGTGSVGAMNAFEVTGSAKLGVVALLLDALKGALAVWAARFLYYAGPADFWIGAWSAIGAVLGHNFSPWLRFKGGRGLSTAFGAALVIAWFIAVIWLALFGLAYAIGRDIHGGNLAASILMPGVVTMLPVGLVAALAPENAHRDLAWFALAMGAVILLGHAKIIGQLLKPSLPGQ